MKINLQSLLLNRKLFWAYLTMILITVTIPMNSSEKLNHITIINFRGDYFFHAVMFLPWAFFLPAFKKKQVLWLVLGLSFAAIAEGLQYFLTYRAFNVNDMVANMLGVLISMLFFFSVKKMIGVK